MERIFLGEGQAESCAGAASQDGGRRTDGRTDGRARAGGPQAAQDTGRQTGGQAGRRIGRTGPSEAEIRAQGIDGVLLSGADIRRMRERAHLSVAELAARLHYSRAQVDAWERGRHACPPHMYLVIVRETRAARVAWEQMAEDVRRGRLG